MIQRVFAAGLALQSVLPRVGDAEVRRRVQGVVRQLDDTVRDIRTTIFDLQTTDSDEHPDSLRRRVLDIVTETAGDVLQPTVRMSGAVDSLVTGELAADVEAVVREASATRRGTPARRHVTVTLDVGGRRRGGGRGRRPRASTSGPPAAGCATSSSAPARRGGELSVAALPDGGTRLRWYAPTALSASARGQFGRAACGLPRSSVARTAAWVRRSSPSFASRWDT